MFFGTPHKHNPDWAGYCYEDQQARAGARARSVRAPCM